MKGNAMSQVFARMNFRLPTDVSIEQVAEWQSILHDAGIEGGAWDDIDVFYSEKENVIGISVPLENDPMLLLEAGSILGYVTAEVDRSKLQSPQRWISIHNENGNVIESPV